MKRFFYFGFLLLAACHSPVKKESVKVDAKKDTPTRIVKDTAKPAVQAEVKKAPPDTYIILDTVVKGDTIKVALYNNTMMRCSLNRLSDVLNASPEVRAWDSSYTICEGMIIPGKKKPVKLILNDSVLIVCVFCGYMSMDGAVQLYLLNRTKHTLKFAKGKNPIAQNPCDWYVDLRKNAMLNYYYHNIYDYPEDAGDGQYSRWDIERYKISNKRFVKTDEVLSYYPEFNYGYDDSIPAEKAFYMAIMKGENWERDKYDTSKHQLVTVVDTIVDKDTIKVTYNNKGNIVCRLNRLCDSTTWKQTWVGFEEWRNNNFKRIVVQGNRKPRAFIVNDSVLLFTLVNEGNTTGLFLFDIRKKSIAKNFVNNYAEYVYADMKSNLFMSYVGSHYRDHIYEDKVYGNPDNSPYKVCEYRIVKDHFLKIKNTSTNIENAEAYFPANYNDYYQLYNTINKRKK